MREIPNVQMLSKTPRLVTRPVYIQKRKAALQFLRGRLAHIVPVLLFAMPTISFTHVLSIQCLNVFEIHPFLSLVTFLQVSYHLSTGLLQWPSSWTPLNQAYRLTRGQPSNLFKT